MSDLMSKLAISKAIMDRHNGINRGSIPQGNIPSMNHPELDDYSAPEAKYNIPQDMLQETQQVKPMNLETPSKDRILNSKLPDEIKRLMIENPIESKNPLMGGGGSVLSDELVEKATKLMGNSKPQQQPQRQSQPIAEESNLRKMMKEVVEEVLKENGLIVESTSKTNDIMVIKVGQHLFEGKISKVKKLK